MGKTHLTGHVRAAAAGCGGVIHDFHHHATRFTVVGNHLAQHDDLSLTAIGLAVYIQSVPTGTLIDIKTLTRRYKEGARRISAGLRELESAGYLRRERERLAGGRIVTRTVYCNKPGGRGDTEVARGRAETSTGTAAAGARAVPAPTLEPAGVLDGPDALHAFPEGEGEGAADNAQLSPAPTAPCGTASSSPSRRPEKRRALPPVPQPSSLWPALVERAVELLTGLRRFVPELRFSAREIEHLTPGVVAWLERDVSAGEVRRALFTGLPEEGLRRPAAFVAYRLRADLPPALPVRSSAAVERTSASATLPVRHPLRNCAGCDRAYRGPDPERCRGCADVGVDVDVVVDVDTAMDVGVRADAGAVAVA
jgi:hypothetical protein